MSRIGFFFFFFATLDHSDFVSARSSIRGSINKCYRHFSFVTSQEKGPHCPYRRGEELKWFEKGVKEAIYVRALQPSLYRDRGRYNLPPILKQPDNEARQHIGPRSSNNTTVGVNKVKGVIESFRGNLKTFWKSLNILY